MHVGVYSPDFPAHLGGGHTFEREILHALASAARNGSHTITVFSPHAGPIAGIDLPVVKLSWAPAMAAGKVRRVINRLRRSIVNDEARFARMLLRHGVDVMYYPTFKCLTHEIPYLVTVWDLQHRLQPFFPEVSRNRAWILREDEYRLNLQRASFVIAGTEAGKKEIEFFYQVPAERIRLLPHPTPRFALQAGGADDVLRDLQLPEQFLFYPAQFWPHKNHVGLLHALRRLRQEYGIVMSVVFVGSDQGNLGHVQREVERLNLRDQVRFLGFVSREVLVALYRQACALVYPTFFGPENLPPLEAFALGCPVIASAVPGAQEQLGDAAVLFDPRSETALADAIRALRDDPALRTALIERGRRRTRRFQGSDFVAGVLAIVDEFESIRRCWKAA